MMNFIPGPFLTYLYLLNFYISVLFYEKFSGVSGIPSTGKVQNSTILVPSLKLLRCSVIHTCHMLQLVSEQHIQAHFPFLFSISKSWLISSYSLSSNWSYCLGSCLLLQEFLKLLFRGL